MNLRPMPPYFLVKIKRDDKPKEGTIIVPDTIRYMAYNTQCGEITAIGEQAAKYFPEAKIGMTLLIHHFVQAESDAEARLNHLVHSDDTFNYYVVTAYEYQSGSYSKNCETYGVWDMDG